MFKKYFIEKQYKTGKIIKFSNYQNGTKLPRLPEWLSRNGCLHYLQYENIYKVYLNHAKSENVNANFFRHYLKLPFKSSAKICI